MVKCGVLYDVRTEVLNITKMSVGFRGLINYKVISSRIKKSTERMPAFIYR
jgi:hypothetical protein